ncbi:MAG: SH3 domain-containing protein, partial [Clostridia bacterium]|nr:SH3 domain-containing protein [Clostridia bacterium]
MKHTFKKVLPFLLTALFLLAIIPMVAFAETTEAKKEQPTVDDSENYGYIQVPDYGSHALTDRYLRNVSEGKINPQKSGLPSRYDSRDYGYVTPVKNQGGYGTCWSFSTIAPIETYMIKHGIIDSDTGKAATNTIDLSELHLAWFTYSDSYDKLGMLKGDYSRSLEKNYLDRGGDEKQAAYTLMRWAGPASEKEYALRYSSASYSGLDSKYAYNYDIAHITDAIWIPVSNTDAVKSAIKDHGAASTGMYVDIDNYLNGNTGAYYYNGSPKANHGVTVVGWDDNYSRNNFKSSCRPNGNGAWIIKNSWGTGYGDRGYFYVSYEDTGINSCICSFYKVSSSDNYVNCYQYDGTSNIVSCKYLPKNSQIANVFTAQGAEKIKAVAISTRDEATSYTLEIYKNPVDVNDPTSGTLMTTQTGSIDFPGYHSIPLSSPVALSPGDKFSVVFTLSAPNYWIAVPYDATASIYWVEWVHADNGKTSFFREENGSWQDTPDKGDFRIKAYTDLNCMYTVNVNGNTLIMRTDHDFAASVKTYIPNGALLIVDRIYNGWGRTTFNGNTGWVYLTNCIFDGNINRYYTVNISATTLNVRADHNSSSAVIDSLPNGAILYVKYFYNGWGKITYNGRDGWVHLSNCKYNSSIDRTYTVITP